MTDDSAPRIEIDVDPTAANAAGSHGKTMPHATVDWMAGFDDGRTRGAAELDAEEEIDGVMHLGRQVDDVLVVERHHMRFDRRHARQNGARRQRAIANCGARSAHRALDLTAQLLPCGSRWLGGSRRA